MSGRIPKVHELKLLPEHYAGVVTGEKRAEFRFNDRDFRAGDVLKLREWTPPPSSEVVASGVAVVHGYTGREVQRKVTHVLTHEAFTPVPEGWVVISMVEPEPPARETNVAPITAVVGTSGRVPPEGVLNGAVAAGLREVVVLGWLGESDRDGPGELYVAASAREDVSLYLMKRAEHHILTLAEES